jgi:hypothetical protein
MSTGTIPGKRRRSDATPGKAGKVRIDLKKMKAEKVPESPPKTIKDDDREVDDGYLGEDDDADDGDFEEDASTMKLPPAKRAQGRAQAQDLSNVDQEEVRKQPSTTSSQHRRAPSPIQPGGA